MGSARGGSSPPLGTRARRACSSARIERSPAEAEVAGSSPAKRAITYKGRLAQRSEHLSYKEEAGGSNPPPPIFVSSADSQMGSVK